MPSILLQPPAQSQQEFSNNNNHNNTFVISGLDRQSQETTTIPTTTSSSSSSHFSSSTINPATTIKNRRLLYLQKQEQYYDRSSHAFNLPELYQQLVARFFTGSERRDAASQPTNQKRFSELLARDLERGEDRLAKLKREHERGQRHDNDGVASSSASSSTLDPLTQSNWQKATTSVRGSNGLKRLPEESSSESEDNGNDNDNDNLKDEDIDEGIDDDDDDDDMRTELTIAPDILLHTNSEGNFNSITDRAEAWEIWCDILRKRFLDGEDEDVDYKQIDEGLADSQIERELERDAWDKWFDDEEVEEMDAESGDTGVLDY